MNRRKHALTALALALLVSLAGCGFFLGNDGEEEVPDSEQIKADAVAQMEAVNAYNYSMVTTVAFGDNSMTTEAVGTVNVSAQKMSANPMQTSVKTNSTKTTKVTRVFIFDDQQCAHVNDSWEQQPVDRSPWVGGANMSAQQDLLNDSSASVYNGTLNGEDVYVVEVTPDKSAIDQLVGDVENVEFQNVTYTQYVDTDSKRLLKSDMDAQYIVNGREATMSVEMSFSDYGTKHEITLPGAAVGNENNPGPCAGMTTNSSA
ncbi:hypothetical protein [Haloarchaeobius sp. DFWS5]|uniref:hypothetical protein n=1 Tax=Haloarchaeobius sp. DFWS5 TaxID=3446114 RepID=UPI003EBAD744